MGVPTFYRWLHDRYKAAIHNYREDVDVRADADEWPPNPNGFEVDSLYLDFNQVVHQATHPSDKLAPVDDRCLTQLGGCVVVAPDAEKFAWRDGGICNTADFEEVLEAL